MDRPFPALNIDNSPPNPYFVSIENSHFNDNWRAIVLGNVDGLVTGNEISASSVIGFSANYGDNKKYRNLIIRNNTFTNNVVSSIYLTSRNSNYGEFVIKENRFYGNQAQAMTLEYTR